MVKKKGKYFWQENETLSNGKEKALKETHRLYLFHQILTQHPKVVNTKRKNDFEPLNQPVIKKNKIYYTLWNMDEIKYTYNGKFEGNIVIIGRIGCGKTTFVQNLGNNKLFREINEVYWVSKIELSKEREEKIEESFKDQEVSFQYRNNFHYRNNVDDFDYLIDVFKRRKSDYVNNDLGAKIILDKLIVTNDVSGLADRSDEFANFLTVYRKYGLTCVYIFHTIYPTRQNWQMIMSQTQMVFFSWVCS